ncbi:MAG TPA: hypothetical protein VGG75_34650, partial [Trebonia sp.]
MSVESASADSASSGEVLGKLPGDTEPANPEKSVTSSSPVPEASQRSRGLRRLLGPLRRHLPFCVVVGVAALLRLVVMLGYPPAMFFNDSYSYLNDVMTGQPDPERSNGYPFFLRVLMPLHSFSVVTGIQALMGLVMGVLIYAVLRRRGLAWWGAAL